MPKEIRCLRGFIIVLILLFSSLAFATEIRILHVNDFHGFAEGYKTFGSDRVLGGASYLAGIIERLRKEKPSLLLSAGDMIQGHNWANLFEGKSVIELMNTMNFDAMVVGNHEFDYGVEVLRNRVSEAIFPILGANIEGADFLKPYIVREIDRVRVAIIGVVTEDTPVATDPKNVQGLRFLSVEETVKRYLAELKDRADLFIVLSHLGFKRDRELAERVKGIHVIVGGHSHTKVEKPHVVHETIITQAWEHGKAVGVLDIKFEDGKVVQFSGRLIEIGPHLSFEDEKVKAIVDSYSKSVNAILDEKIGFAEEDLDGENVRRAETNLGNLIADIMRETSGAEIAIINGGGIRTGIKRGEIKVKDVYSVLPFNNYILAIKLKGSEIKEALEHGLSAIEESSGRFPQVSGIRFIYDLNAEVGSRVREIYISEKPIEMEREYIVAINDFLAAGGDGYSVFSKVLSSSKDYESVGGVLRSEKIVYSDSGRYLRDVVVSYIKNKGIVSTKVQGRIKVLSSQ